jgi:putative SOS response-associated peptidase YedK
MGQKQSSNSLSYFAIAIAPVALMQRKLRPGSSDFAGLWRPIAAGGEAFTLLTTDPNPDVASIHDRQMVVLERSDWSAWLEQTGNEADLLRALPAGSVKVEQVR